jgi:predicted site-specific integrase-resolvase
MKESPLLDEREASRRLGVSVSTLRNWRYLGRGPKTVKVLGVSLRYPLRDLERFCKERGARGGAR